MDAGRKEMKEQMQRFQSEMKTSLEDGLREMRLLRNLTPSATPSSEATAAAPSGAADGSARSLAKAREVVDGCQGKPVGQQRVLLRAQIVEWGGDVEAANGENKVLSLINMLYSVATA